jgi:hypothetical protein
MLDPGDGLVDVWYIFASDVEAHNLLWVPQYLGTWGLIDTLGFMIMLT